MINRLAAFFRTSLGKAAAALFVGVLAFCTPQIPGYAVGVVALYVAIHEFRPVALWIYEDIRGDLRHADATDGSGDER